MASAVQRRAARTRECTRDNRVRQAPPAPSPLCGGGSMYLTTEHSGGQAEKRQADMRDSYAFEAIRLGFGEAAAREFLLVDYHLEHGQPGIANIERDGLDFLQGNRLDSLLEFASGSQS